MGRFPMRRLWSFSKSCDFVVVGPAAEGSSGVFDSPCKSLRTKSGMSCGQSARLAWTSILIDGKLGGQTLGTPGVSVHQTWTLKSEATSRPAFTVLLPQHAITNALKVTKSHIGCWKVMAVRLISAVSAVSGQD